MGFKRLLEPAGAVGDIGEFELGADEIHGGGNQPESLDLGVRDGLSGEGLPQDKTSIKY